MIAFLITVLTAGVLRYSRRLGRWRTTAALAFLTASAVLYHVDGFDFHGRGVYVHYHDAAHYYLGARYFPELGYGGLYAAMLAAEREDTGTVAAAVARDLRRDRLVDADTLVEHGRAVRARFEDDRWQAFRADAAFFRRALGERYPGFLVDHGFNPTPVWALVGGTLARAVPAGGGAGILGLCLLDALLLAWVWRWLARAFGLDAALAGAILFLTVFEGGFAWTGGAFLRHLWLVAVLAGCCLLRFRRHAGAGALFALAAMLRIFPAFLVLGIAARAAWGIFTRRELRSGHRRLLAAFAATAGGFFVVTVALSGGFEAWRLFAENMALYLGTEAANFVGLERILAWTLGELLPAWPPQVAVAVGVSRALAGMLAFAVAFALARRRNDLGAIALGGLLLFACLAMAAYYYVFLVVLVLAHRRQPRALGLIFSVEAASHLAGWILGAVDLGVLDAAYALRSLLLLFLFGALYLQDGADELRSLMEGLGRAISVRSEPASARIPGDGRAVPTPSP